MTKPLVNLADLTFDDVEDSGYYSSRRALFSAGIGARKLGYNLTELPPGKAQCPFHSHREEEEMFFIVEGEGELRFGDQRHPIITAGTTTLRYLAVTNQSDTEVCEYPDANKVGLFSSAPGGAGLRKMFRAERVVDHYDREPQALPPSA